MSRIKRAVVSAPIIEFDFERMARAMALVNWTWAPLGGQARPIQRMLGSAHMTDRYITEQGLASGIAARKGCAVPESAVEWRKELVKLSDDELLCFVSGLKLFHVLALDAALKGDGR